MGLHEEGISIRSGYVIIIDPSATLYMKIQVQALALDQGMWSPLTPLQPCRQ